MQMIWALFTLVGFAIGGCPYMEGEPAIKARQPMGSSAEDHFLDEFTVDDSNSYLTSTVGSKIQDDKSLKAGERGPTLLEDVITLRKIQHFDHERVPERAVHARGAAAHGVFTSYGDWSNITAASLLNQTGKETPVFVRFSTVAGSRGSADTVRDVHGFATRFYTDEGNWDLVGNNIPVFFIQDAILFPDLIHSVKPAPDREIPQAATAHDSAWDFFSQQPSALHTLFWAMAGNGIPRSYRHMDGFGVHSFRLVTNEGTSKFVKFHWKTLQGKASLVWEEAQILAGKNADYHRDDLWNAIESGNGPEWEFGVQVVDEEDALSFGFDILDATKIIPEELVPVTPLGKMKLNRNPRNYFAETEQVMYQVGHVVRGIDFSEDPLLQGRIYSYFDTQINRHGGPNYDQLPINRPHVDVHNNQRDGAGQNFIHLNTAAYSPNTLSNGSPRQANQTVGNGFFTSPTRRVEGNLVRATSPTFADVWSQARMFYNSLIPVEQQFLINAMRFEASQLKSEIVKSNVLIQLNRVSHDIARRVGEALGMQAPAADPTYYNDNRTAFVSIFNHTLPTVRGFKVAVLTSDAGNGSLSQAAALRQAFAPAGVSVVVVGERLVPGVNATYSAADATAFDGIIVASGAEVLWGANATSTLFPSQRPKQILSDGYRWGKPVGAMGSAEGVLRESGVDTIPGVYAGGDVQGLVKGFVEGLGVFKFVDRFAVDS
ncbi:catalase-like domain-containing protein [Amylocarpus encephaloides]|uniref:Catalase n=1 Tax=Amylocarpus encephaloides TaxID=45428 RepID=A0A9P7YQT5_9HELO|nr:catalase-like domain-containing protein [Amylocarpus encephaloides]